MSANCPGFKPHGVKPTRCRRCFKEYSEHVKKDDILPIRKKSLSSLLSDSDNQQSKPLSSSASATTQDKSKSCPLIHSFLDVILHIVCRLNI